MPVYDKKFIYVINCNKLCGDRLQSKPRQQGRSSRLAALIPGSSSIGDGLFHSFAL